MNYWAETNARRRQEYLNEYFAPGAAAERDEQAEHCELWESDPSAIIDGERGAVAPVPNQPGQWWVKGTETVYLVDTGKPGELTRGVCECRGHQYRGTCAHLDAVVEFCGEMREDARLSAWVQASWFGEVIWAPSTGRTAEEERLLREMFA